MYKALYRKYRPATFSEVVGQEHITETLKGELSSGKIFHAYLFTGTRGTGKTSCAKILAKAVNCENPVNGDPCEECDSCRNISAGEVMDIVEIDAASNNGVDDVRLLREQAVFTPASAKYRVYIIDEVHMLSKPAFNALLKTLEEPPAHVIFILATTEVQELPATILSRCQRFDFSRIDTEVIKARLLYVAENENLSVSDNAASLIAALSDGCLRDALSLLDLCAGSQGEVTETTVESVCGMAGREYLNEMTGYIRDGDVGAALSLLDRLYGASVDVKRLCSELISHFRDLMILKSVNNGSALVVCSDVQLKILKTLAQGFDIKDIMNKLDILQGTLYRLKGPSARCEMEMALVRLCTPSLTGDIASLEKRIEALEKGTPAAKPSYSVAAAASAPRSTAAAEKKKQPDSVTPDNSANEVLKEKEVTAKSNPDDLQPQSGGDFSWNAILAQLMKTAPLIYGMLSGSTAEKGDKVVRISTDNTGFWDIIGGDSLGSRRLEDSILQVTGERLRPVRADKPHRPEVDPLNAFGARLKALSNDSHEQE